MLGPSQGRGLPSPDARVPGFQFHHGDAGTAGHRSRQPVPVVAVSGEGVPAALVDGCPMCGKQPVEPVRIDGQLACQSCTAACSVCGHACVPGDGACRECLRLPAMVDLVLT